jgi:hypothetical protein
MEGISFSLLAVLTLIIILPQTGMFFFLFRWLKDSQEKTLQLKMLEIKAEQSKDIRMLRLQAYERLILFLERINPSSLIPRTFQSDMLSQELQLALIQAIRAEYEHNLSQQIYVSAHCWRNLSEAKDHIAETISLIASQVPPDAPGSELAKRILQGIAYANQPLPTKTAIEILREEVRSFIE